MVENENAFSYMDAALEYIERHGKRIALYSDTQTVFRNPVAAQGATP
ncbi:hypothetical protein [Sphingomonas sp. PAMC 26605]|nr:hypothetical protein [Sphingomonas sp. PAMC 26605]